MSVQNSYCKLTDLRLKGIAACLSSVRFGEVRLGNGCLFSIGIVSSDVDQVRCIQWCLKDSQTQIILSKTFSGPHFVLALANTLFADFDAKDKVAIGRLH